VREITSVVHWVTGNTGTIIIDGFNYLREFFWAVPMYIINAHEIEECFSRQTI
jgi:hypothetical protein